MRAQTTDKNIHMLGVLLFADVNPLEAKIFLYDESNTPIGMRYRSHTDTDYTTFWFEKNLQGDIVAVYSADGVKQVSYAYDAWGMPFYTIHVSGTKAYENPFLYRGYYYEEDLTLYRTQTRLYDPYMGRFVSPDLLDVITASPMALTDKNLYTYCDNNPVTRVDPDGMFWDYVVDIGFLAWSVSDVVNNPSDWKNWVALATDIVFAVVPFVPSGAGQAIKVGNKIDNALDVANTINKVDNIQNVTKVTMIGRGMDRVTSTANLIGKADNLYDAWKGYDVTATGLKKLLHNGISMAHNGNWLLGKLRQGYTVIDIGLSTMHKGRGLWYGTERFVLGLWKTRNIWKVPINYYF